VSKLLDKRLVFVTGKGGVGKSTVAAALGLLSARAGRRTIIAELARQQRVQNVFGAVAEPFEEVQLREGLFAISLDPQEAMEEYFRVRTGAIGQTLGSSRVFQTFAMATPGMRELLSVGKVWELAQARRRTAGADVYDTVIVDAPATGHGVGILRTPATFAAIARVGPIAQQARNIAATLADREFTGVLAVSTPEEMPVSETLMLERSLQEAGLELDLTVLNAVYPRRFSSRELGELARALESSPSPLARGALRAALTEAARATLQRRQGARLRSQVGSPVLELPTVFAEELGPQELEELAGRLEEALDRLAAGTSKGARRRAQGGARA
jgi:anion-transporting  ArsA/GET3 family ATPase